jgi:serine/threonine protein kinase
MFSIPSSPPMSTRISSQRSPSLALSAHSLLPSLSSPQNILIAEDGTPLLTDFGSVRLANISIHSRSQVLSLFVPSSPP